MIDEEFERVVRALIPMGKLIESKEIVDIILFLVNEKTRMLIEQVIKVFGEHMIKMVANTCNLFY